MLLTALAWSCTSGFRKFLSLPRLSALQPERGISGYPCSSCGIHLRLLCVPGFCSHVSVGIAVNWVRVIDCFFYTLWTMLENRLSEDARVRLQRKLGYCVYDNISIEK
jgi:hypothetical protein